MGTIVEDLDVGEHRKASRSREAKALSGTSSSLSVLRKLPAMVVVGQKKRCQGQFLLVPDTFLLECRRMHREDPGKCVFWVTYVRTPLVLFFGQAIKI
jgi:hypothetical protein